MANTLESITFIWLYVELKKKFVKLEEQAENLN